MKMILLFTCAITLITTTGCFYGHGGGGWHDGHGWHDRGELIAPTPAYAVRAPEVIVAPPVVAVNAPQVVVR
jgi:hypothetical protein